MKRFEEDPAVRWSVKFAVVITLVTLIILVGRWIARSIALKHAPPALVSIMELVGTDEGEALMSAAEAMSSRDIDLAVERISAVQFCTENSDGDSWQLSKSSSTSIWFGISGATHLAARRERRASEPLRNSLTRAFLAMHSRGEYHPFEDRGASTFWRNSSHPVENYLWALMRIDGIDGYEWVEQAVHIHGEQEPKWSEDVKFFASVLCWATYADDIDTIQWPWARPNAFDKRWPLRFLAAARERGYKVNVRDVRNLTDDLTELIVDYEPDLARMEGENFEAFWLAASASILLAELRPTESLRRIFPLGAAQDVDMAIAPAEWAVQRE